MVEMELSYNPSFSPGDLRSLPFKQLYQLVYRNLVDTHPCRLLMHTCWFYVRRLHADQRQGTWMSAQASVQHMHCMVAISLGSEGTALSIKQSPRSNTVLQVMAVRATLPPEMPNLPKCLVEFALSLHPTQALRQSHAQVGHVAAPFSC